MKRRWIFLCMLLFMASPSDLVRADNSAIRKEIQALKERIEELEQKLEE
jgi:hypothetical protein